MSKIVNIALTLLLVGVFVMGCKDKKNAKLKFQQEVEKVADIDEKPEIGKFNVTFSTPASVGSIAGIMDTKSIIGATEVSFILNSLISDSFSPVNVL